VAPGSIDELEAALREADHLPDRGLTTALYLSLALEKPVLLEGDAGVGKTEAAKALATALDARLIRLQCYEGLDVAHAVYEWNDPRQLLHIRAAQEGTVTESELFGPEYLIRRPLLEAIDTEEPVVLLIDEIDRADVSGSLDAYARVLLLFLHAAVGAGRGVEAFAFGTRRSRLTPDLRTRDPLDALARCTEAVVDWGSGTRIGASLREFNEVYGRRAMSRGAIVVIVSDGWEREDPALVGREMARLARAAYAVIWVNPLKGNPDYQPLAGGMRAALPFVDRFLAGHNLRSLEELATVLAGVERRHAA
jgi:hypothetical protein